VGKLVEQRRIETATRIRLLRNQLKRAEELCSDKACVYMTGSFARGEASRHSDLDLFIVSTGSREKPTLRKLDEILIEAQLIDATRKLEISDFSGDGEYLVHYPADELKTRLGTQQDDFNNTFTARLLLLLESSPLLGRSAYHTVIKEVINAYWRDYPHHKANFMPAFLANDILRMWRTFCVNYEARTQKTPPAKRAKRRLMNYKLKHSRLLTCYSALFYLLTVFEKNKTVTPKDAAHMVSLTPTQRLDWLVSEPKAAKAHSGIQELIKKYEFFLHLTDASKTELVRLFGDNQRTTEYWESAYAFGDLAYQILDTLGRKSRFYRLLVV
jgi:predicted nucleotidyltransferase